MHESTPARKMRSDQKDIFIIGSGAIGRALAVFLNLSGRRVTIIRGSINDGTRKVERLRVEMGNGAILESDIKIATLNTFTSLEGLILLANKSFGNAQLALSLRNKTGNSPLVLLQNGLGVEKPFIDLSFPAVYRAVLFVTSQRVDSQMVRFRPVAPCPVGIVRGDAEQLELIVQGINTSHFGFESQPYIDPVLWKKAIVNCVFNSVCPLLLTDNGIFHRDKEALEIARRVISECSVIAQASGAPLHPDEVEASLLQISRLSDGQEISTLQDIRNKRMTEIETLNPEIIRIAASLGMEHSVKETRLLGELIRIRSRLSIRSDRDLTNAVL